MPLTADARRQNRIDQFHRKFLEKGIDKIFNEHKVGVASLNQKLVRLASADEWGFVVCVTCEKRVHYKAAHGSHYIDRMHKAAIIHEDNVWPCCKNCNKYRDGNLPKFKTFLLETIGLERFEHLETLRHSNVNWNKYELAVIKYDLLQEIKTHERRLGV